MALLHVTTDTDKTTIRKVLTAEHLGQLNAALDKNDALWKLPRVVVTVTPTRTPPTKEEGGSDGGAGGVKEAGLLSWAVSFFDPDHTTA